MHINVLTSDGTASLPVEVGSHRSLWAKIKIFCTEAYVAAKDKIISFVRGFYHHAESIGLLTLASFGLSALIGELPFLLMLPWWIEATMVIPVLSVLIVYLLVSLGELRTKRRLAHA